MHLPHIAFFSCKPWMNICCIMEVGKWELQGGNSRHRKGQGSHFDQLQTVPSPHHFAAALQQPAPKSSSDPSLQWSIYTFPNQPLDLAPAPPSIVQDIFLYLQRTATGKRERLQKGKIPKRPLTEHLQLVPAGSFPPCTHQLASIPFQASCRDFYYAIIMAERTESL